LTLQKNRVFFKLYVKAGKIQEDYLDMAQLAPLANKRTTIMLNMQFNK